MLIKRIICCSRCGHDHEQLEAKRFERPFAPSDVTTLVWTHWATCPSNGDPILVIVTDETDTDAEYPPGTPAKYEKPEPTSMPGPADRRGQPNGGS